MAINDTPMPAWIYSLADYRKMFALTDADLSRTILDYPGGISSFNAEVYAQGYSIQSADPCYHIAADDMVHFVDDVIAHNQTQLAAADQTQVVQAWQQSKAQFLADYALGQQQGRYQVMDLPLLPVADQRYQLMLCPNLMFTKRLELLNSEQIIIELCRVAEEVRIFPVVNDEGELSESLGPLLLTLQQRNYGVEIREVGYQQYHNGNVMLRLWARECVVEE